MPDGLDDDGQILRSLYFGCNRNETRRYRQNGGKIHWGCVRLVRFDLGLFNLTTTKTAIFLALRLVIHVTTTRRNA